MELREIFQIIYKRMWIVVLITVVAVIVSGVVSLFFLKDVYEASATLMVSKAQEDQQGSAMQYNDILLYQKLVNTYSEIIKSDRILDKVIEKLQQPVTADDIRQKIFVNSVKDTEIIEIKAEDNAPQFAAELANTIAVVFMSEVPIIMKMDNVQLIDAAKVPIDRVKPRPMLNIAIAGVLGLMVSVGVVFLIEYLDNTVKTSEDIEQYIGLPVLASIPEFHT
jgi:capsular polysaccharide biosynthesis protein